MKRALIASLLFVGCGARPAAKSAAPPPSCEIEVASYLHPGFEQIGEVVILDEERYGFLDPYFLATRVKPEACRLGGEAISSISSDPVGEGEALKFRDAYAVLRRKPAAR